MRIPLRKIHPPQDPEVIASLTSNSPEILISGPRNCSKSFTIQCYILALHERYPGFQSLVLRSEMKTMGTLYDQLNQKILRYPLTDERNPFVFKASSKDEPRPHILFDNGGKMCFGGLDNSDKSLGSELDLAFYNQAERETKMKHVSDILGCMEGGRAGNWKTKNGLKYQLICDANPAHRKHLLMQRVNSGAMEWYQYTHKSHPLFYDWKKMEYTQRGIETRDGLLRAYPEGYLRQAHGLW